MKKFKLEIPTMGEIYRYIIELAEKIKDARTEYDLVIGVARGGLIPARILGDLLRISEIKIIYSKYYKGPYETMEKPIIDAKNLGDLINKRILLVDDVADTGDTLIEISKLLEERGAHVDIAVIYVKPWNKANIKYFSRKTDAWIVFPWEFVETSLQLIKEGRKELLLDELSKKPEMKRIYIKFVEEK